METSRAPCTGTVIVAAPFTMMWCDPRIRSTRQPLALSSLSRSRPVTQRAYRRERVCVQAPPARAGPPSRSRPALLHAPHGNRGRRVRLGARKILASQVRSRRRKITKSHPPRRTAEGRRGSAPLGIFDNRQREVLVGVEPGHSGALVFPNLVLDFLSVGTNIRPRIGQVLRTERRVSLQEFRISGPQSSCLLQGPDGYSGPDNTRRATANTGGTFDSRNGITPVHYMPHTVTGAAPPVSSRRKILASQVRSGRRSNTTKCPSAAAQRCR